MNPRPDSFSPLPPEDRIDKICDAFERAWHNAEYPQIVQFLELGGDLSRKDLFSELLLVELELRHDRNELPTRNEYLRQFPEFAEQIEAIDFRQGFAPLPQLSEDADGGPAATAFAPGSRVAHFCFNELLGTGAVGEVWKATDTRLQRIVAIKVPRSRNLTEAEMHRFLREGRAAAQLNHPNIVPIHEVGRDGPTPYIVSKYVSGADLRHHLAAGPFPPVSAAEICAKLANALGHAHFLGIVHRDLKPANVLLDGRNEPHITDFGLAKWTHDSRDLTLHGQLLGTIAYMAPEQASGQVGLVDHRTDVYALGAALYEMLTGRGPFQGDEVSVIHKIVSEKFVAPPIKDRQIPSDLRTICLKALEKDPRRRFQSADEFGADLERFLRRQPIRARRVSPLERSWRWIKRRPSVAVALALFIVAAIATLGVVSLSQENFELQGFRPIKIKSMPAGARIALVPMDRATGQLSSNPEDVVRPWQVTPLTTYIKPGTYLVEAAHPASDDSPRFSEVYLVVPEQRRLKHAAQNNKRNESLNDPIDVQIMIPEHLDEVVVGMVPIPIGESLRREHPELPALIYVDMKATLSIRPPHGTNWNSENDEDYDQLQAATIWAAEANKRLPSASEFDAIIASLATNDVNVAKTSQGIEGLFDDIPEWTTSTYAYFGAGRPADVDRLKHMIVLKGFRDITPFSGSLLSPEGQLLCTRDVAAGHVAMRFVRSGAPRYISGE